MRRSSPSRWPAAVLAALFLQYAAAGEIDCGSLENGYGPYDYSNAENREKYIPIVEKHHFTTDVRSLTRGVSGSVMAELDYTLRAVPNHHPALDAVSRYSVRGGSRETYMTAECYFDRALRFKANDPETHLIYGIHLHRRKKLQEAEQQYREALELRPDSAETHYNLALLYTDLGQWDRAKQDALEAYKQGYPLAGVKNRLKSRGLWSESDERSVAEARASANH